MTDPNDLAAELDANATEVEDGFDLTLDSRLAARLRSAAALLREQAEQLDTLLNAIEAHRDAPDIVRFRAYTPGRFSAADTHLYAALAAAGGGVPEEGATDDD